LNHGNVIVKELSSSALTSREARVTRVKTLDRGVYIGHAGYVAGDRTLSVVAEISALQRDILTEIFETQTSVLVSTREGVFLAAIAAMSTENGKLDMTIFVKNKL